MNIDTDNEDNENIDLKPAIIETRRDLVTYLEEYVPQNFFFTEKNLKELDQMTLAEREYNSPLLQRNMNIIGKVVITSTHVKRQDCDGPKDFESCYPILDLTED